MNNLSQLEKKIGTTFKQKNLLELALIHRSYVNENAHVDAHNERLEFLGDAVLELVVTEYLYTHFPNPEGDLTNWRAALVNAKMLAEVARENDLENYLLLSKGEAKDAHSKARQYILANTVEALIGALYIDQGYTVAKTFINKAIISKLDYILENKLYIDAKSKFQEEAQARTGITPNYQVLEETGPDHDKWFRIGVYLNDELIASGEGSSKQEAQMNSAEQALKAKSW